MLILQNLNLSYNQKQLFANFSICLYQSSITLLKGINGSGKTSLLKIIASLNKADSGDISYIEDNVNYVIRDNRNLINYISHVNAVKDELTIFENIEFWAKLYDSYELILTAIHYFKLTNYIDVQAAKVSQGIKQKVALARLILKPSKIWLLDEPENNLDKQSKDLLNNLIISKADQGGIIIIASHNQYHIKNLIEINIDDFKKISEF